MNFLLTHAPILIIALPLLGAFLTPLISRLHPKMRNIFVLTILIFTGFLTMLLTRDVLANGIRVYVLGAAPSTLTVPTGSIMPVRIILETDALSVLMAMISVSLAFVSALYSSKFMENRTGLDKYYTLLLLLLAGMLGMELTGDLFNLFVFLEITSISGCALVAFYTDRGESAEAAFKYMLIGTVGALFVLFAVALLYGEYDALNIGYLANKIQYSFLDKIALVLLVGAFAMKAGSVPMHMWKPDAYGEAPASVVIMLVTSSLASLYALLRVCFTLYGNVLNTAVVGWIIIVLGVLSIFVGVTMALVQNKFSRLIGYTAVAEIGYMLLGVGVGLASLTNGSIEDYGLKAVQGGLFHIMNDALDLGLLFLVAGAVFYSTGKSDLNKLGGLAHNMKYTTIFFMIGLAAVSGLPPMNGFASKLIIYETSYQLEPLGPILSIIAILSSILMLAVFVKVFHSAFLGPKLKEYENVKDAPRSMLIAMGILAVFIIIFGLFPDTVINTIIKPAANALIDYQGYIDKIMGGV